MEEAIAALHWLRGSTYDITAEYQVWQGSSTFAHGRKLKYSSISHTI
jgi:hypothetical protein